MKNKTVKGVGWSFADTLLGHGITFLVGLVLANILTPDDYGLIGIITIFISVFNCIVDSGFSNALIRKPNADERDYNTVFISNMVLSLFMFAVLLLCTPLISGFFKRPELTPLLRVMSVIILINAFAIIQRTIFVKKVDFKTQTKVSLISSITSGVVGIGMALAGLGVWSLVGQQITKQLLNTLLLWVYAHWYPKLQFSAQSFKQLFGFGWKLLVSSLIDTIWREIYQVVIGKCYSSATLGHYTRAQQFSSICSQNLNTVVQRVSFPVLSSIQDDKERLKAAYRRIIKTTMLVTFVLMLGMAGSAKAMVQALIGDQWLPCVPYLQIICFSMALYPLHAINLNMLQVQGRSDLFLKLEIIKKIVAVGPLLLGIFINIYWMLLGSVVVGWFAYYLNAYYSGPFLKYKIIDQVKDILPSLGIALTMALLVYAMSFIPLTPYALFPIQVVVGALITVALCRITKLPEYFEIRTIVSDYLGKTRQLKS